MNKQTEGKIDFRVDTTRIIKQEFEQQKEDIRSLCEGYQNMRDALVIADRSGKKNLFAKITINEDSVIFEDNGLGMSLEEVKKFLTVIGSSSKVGDSELVGNKGKGIVQLFNLGVTTIVTQDKEYFIDKRVKIQLSFTNLSEYYEGFKMVVKFYEPFYSVEISEFLRKMEYFGFFLPEGSKYIVNGEIVKPEISFNKKTDDYLLDARFTSEANEEGLAIYDSGIYVKTLQNQGFGGKLFCLSPLSLDTSRTNILKSCETFARIQESIDDFVVKKFSQKSFKLYRTAKNACKLLMRKNTTYERILENKPIFQLANRSYISLSDLKTEIASKPFFSAQLGDNIADKIMQQKKAVVIAEYERWNLSYLLNKIACNDRVKLLSLLPDRKTEFVTDIIKQLFNNKEKSEFSAREKNQYNKIMKAFGYALALNRYVFHEERNLELARSPIFAACTNGIDTIWLNSLTLQSMKTGKAELALQIFELLAHEYAHQDDNSETDVHGIEFDQVNAEILNEHMARVGTFIQQNWSVSWKSFISDAEYELSD